MNASPIAPSLKTDTSSNSKIKPTVKSEPPKKAGFLDGVQTATGFGVKKEQYAKEGTGASTLGSLAGTLGTNLALQGGLSALNNTVVPKKFRAATSVIAGVTTAGLTAFSEYQRANADGKVTDAERGNIIAQSLINGGSVALSTALGSQMPGKGKLAAIGIGALDTGMGAGFSVVGNGFANRAQGKRFEENAGQSALMGAGGTLVGYGIGARLRDKHSRVKEVEPLTASLTDHTPQDLGVLTPADMTLITRYDQVELPKMPKLETPDLSVELGTISNQLSTRLQEGQVPILLDNPDYKKHVETIAQVEKLFPMPIKYQDSDIKRLRHVFFTFMEQGDIEHLTQLEKELKGFTGRISKRQKVEAQKEAFLKKISQNPEMLAQYRFKQHKGALPLLHVNGEEPSEVFRRLKAALSRKRPQGYYSLKDKKLDTGSVLYLNGIHGDSGFDPNLNAEGHLIHTTKGWRPLSEILNHPEVRALLKPGDRITITSCRPQHAVRGDHVPSANVAIVSQNDKGLIPVDVPIERNPFKDVLATDYVFDPDKEKAWNQELIKYLQELDGQQAP